MSELNFILDPAHALSLQHQLRLRLIDAIHHGVLPPGRRLPSSRVLAQRCAVSRNTVALAYEALIADGHLVSRARSGVFVAAQAATGRIAPGRREQTTQAPAPRLGLVPPGGSYRYPVHWHRYPYPFIDGRIDPDLTPAAEWREAMRLACGRGEALRWHEGGDGEDAQLVEEIRTKVLPAVGIDSGPDELLLTASMAAAMHMVVDVLTQRGTPVLVEEPVDAELRRRLRDRQVSLLPDSALREGLPHGTVCFTSARRVIGSSARERQRAQTLLAAVRAAEGIVVDRYPMPELPDSTPLQPPLRALEQGHRVVHVSALAGIAGCGATPGLIAADARVVELLRQRRSLQGADLPPPLLRGWYYFIGLGHYSATLARAQVVLAERRQALRDALNHYLHTRVTIESTVGSSAYWVRGSGARGAGALDVADLARRAANVGVLIEPESVDGDGAQRFCMGVSGIGKSRIREGVQALARLMRADPSLGARSLAQEPKAPLRGSALHKALAGSTLLYNTVYGDPCTIEVRRDGRLVGTAGYASEDCDVGRWWIEGEHWVRQWDNWAYGEPTAFNIVIDADQLRWYGGDGLLADTAVITRRPPGRRPD